MYGGDSPGLNVKGNYRTGLAVFYLLLLLVILPDTTYARVPGTGTRYQGRLLIGCRIRKSSARQVSLPVGIQ